MAAAGEEADGDLGEPTAACFAFFFFFKHWFVYFSGFLVFFVVLPFFSPNLRFLLVFVVFEF